MPMTRGVVIGAIGSARIGRSSVSPLTGMASRVDSRTPGAPPAFDAMVRCTPASRRVPDPRGCHRGQRLGEDAAGTVRRRTPEAANLQVEFANPALPRQVAQMSGVPTVDACGGATALRTGRPCGPHVGRDGHPISVDGNPVDDKAGWEQRKQ